MAHSDDLLTPEDVEREFKIKVNTQKSYRSRGLIPYVRYGGVARSLVRYRRADLIAWVESRVVGATR